MAQSSLTLLALDSVYSLALALLGLIVLLTLGLYHLFDELLVLKLIIVLHLLAL